MTLIPIFSSKDWGIVIVFHCRTCSRTVAHTPLFYMLHLLTGLFNDFFFFKQIISALHKLLCHCSFAITAVENFALFIFYCLALSLFSGNFVISATYIGFMLRQIFSFYFRKKFWLLTREYLKRSKSYP